MQVAGPTSVLVTATWLTAGPETAATGEYWPSDLATPRDTAWPVPPRLTRQRPRSGLLVEAVEHDGTPGACSSGRRRPHRVPGPRRRDALHL